MERMNFLSITSSNLDEFFMVRVARIMEEITAKSDQLDVSGLNVREQMAKIVIKSHDFVKKQYKCFEDFIIPCAKKSGFRFLKIKNLNQKQKEFIKRYFKEVLFPILTPLSVNRSRPFPFLVSKSLNLAIRTFKKNESNFYVIQVPSIISRILEVPGEKNYDFVLLEDIIMHNISVFFDIKEIKSVCVFRITRNADFDLSKEGEDLLEEIEKKVKKRKRGTAVRLEISKKPDKITRKFLCDVLDVEKYEVYKIDGPLDLTFLNKFLKIKKIEPLKKKSNNSISSRYFLKENDIFKIIKKYDKIFFHPYESFDIVLKFLKQASEDKDVLAIKQTLYRVSKDSLVVESLMKAAENGKQVTVLVELKARFDEESNIIWAKRLEKAGCHVIYGVPGLKTHCKVLLVARKERNKIKRYIHFGTGNYNEITAKTYTDIGFFTCKESFGIDASLLFNTLTAGSNPPKYNKIICSPFKTRIFLKEMVENEIKNNKKGLKGEITVKVNSLSDVEIIKLFYKASNAGVKINLIIRGICCLVPEFNNISENIKVFSIIGKFLEHSRIFKFYNAGEEKIFIGSADLMPRNLDERVELLIPIEDKNSRKKILKFLNKMLNDNVNTRIKLSDSSYKIKEKDDEKVVDSQSDFNF